MRLPLLGVVGLVLTVFTYGCGDSTTTPETVEVATPAMNPEPSFTAGASNLVAWSAGTLKMNDVEYQVEASTTPDFSDVFDDSGWIQDQSYVFNDLADARLVHYRVRARIGEDQVSSWSRAVSSTQDDAPPLIDTETLGSDQTSLRILFTASADDPVSGLDDVWLMAASPGEELSVYGSFVDGEITYVTTSGGRYRFAVVARDQVGNTIGNEPSAVMETNIPDPIIITDQLGEEWDITNAVLAHGMSLWGWDHGIGRNTIRPIVDPVHMSLGDIGYPDADEIFISLVMITENGGESLAMPLNPMYSREVLDDVFNGEPIAMTF